jgi:hypothetical protein
MTLVKVAVERLAFLFCIREAPDSVLGPETGLLIEGSIGLPQFVQANSRIITQIRPRQLPST